MMNNCIIKVNIDDEGLGRGRGRERVAGRANRGQLRQGRRGNVAAQAVVSASAKRHAD